MNTLPDDHKKWIERLPKKGPPDWTVWIRVYTFGLVWILFLIATCWLWIPAHFLNLINVEHLLITKDDI